MPASSERRHFSRIPFDARYRLSSLDQHQCWDGKVIDISLKGALLQQADATSFSNGERFTLELDLDGALALRMAVGIAHVEDHCLGVGFEFMDVPSAGHLRRLLELNLGDAQQAQRELTEMLHLKSH